MSEPAKLKCFVVRSDGFGDFEVEAATPAKARWKTFCAARDAGYFRAGFRAFLAHGFTVFERRG